MKRVAKLSERKKKKEEKAAKLAKMSEEERRIFTEAEVARKKI